MLTKDERNFVEKLGGEESKSAQAFDEIFSKSKSVDLPVFHELYLSEHKEVDAFSVLFNKLIKGERIKFRDGTRIDAEEAITAMAYKYADKYYSDFIEDEE